MVYRALIVFFLTLLMWTGIGEAGDRKDSPFEMVVCTSCPLRRYQVIGTQDVKLVKKNVAHVPQQALTDIKDVVGKRTRRSVGANAIVTTRLVEAVPLVKRGDLVTVVAESPTLKITCKGLVREKGYQDDIVMVTNLGSKKVIYAKVVNGSTVKVEF